MSTPPDLKPPVMASFGPMVLTGMGSSTIGDKLGDAFAEVMAWLIMLGCRCEPPPAVISALHTLCVAGTVGIAFYIHYRFVKPQQ